MSHYENILQLAEAHEKAARDVEERGRRDGWDATSAAAEERDIALILRRGAQELRHMDPANQQDYAHRLRAALWRRMDDSPEPVEYREDPL